MSGEIMQSDLWSELLGVRSGNHALVHSDGPCTRVEEIITWPRDPNEIAREKERDKWREELLD
jgi:hypothetical protein